MSKPRFVLRKIKNGQVKINGKYFKPKVYLDPIWLPYDGRLDGMVYAFGLYYEPDDSVNLVNLWGTEKAYKSYAKEDWPGPECVDGYFNWEFWERI